MKAGAKSYFFFNPVKHIVIDSENEIETKFNQVEKCLKEGLNGFTLIPYETGYIFEERLHKYIIEKNDKPFFEFFFYDNINSEICLTSDLNFDSITEHSEAKTYSITKYKLNTSKESYCRSIDKIKKYIEAGDTYQVNYTVKGNFNFEGDLIALIYNLIYNQSAGYTAIINLGDRLVLTISPELFFTIEGKDIIVKPMKGTIRRGYSLFNDNEKKVFLQNDEKNKAENVMIVDLLRNDLGRICEYDTVKTTSLFDIEKYETLFQMTSTIRGKLNTNNFYEIIKNIYPSGSITGAPKIRTMEIIKELETGSRGYYTGTIGLFVDAKKIFNIPIRTITIGNNNKGEIGIGSGVVWDSIAEEEYEETLLKADFLRKPPEIFELFETMLYESGEIFLYNFHKKRINEAAQYFLFYFDAEKYDEAVNNVLQNFESNKSYRIKIILNKWGQLRVEYSLFSTSNKDIKLYVSPFRIDEKDKYFYFKTTKRKLYDDELNSAKAEGFDEVIFLNNQNEITEGSITNIFLRIGSEWFTPPIESGLLNGCYRDYLLKARSDHHSKKLFLPDLIKCDEIKCVNSLRKERSVSELFVNNKLYKKQTSFTD